MLSGRFRAGLILPLVVFFGSCGTNCAAGSLDVKPAVIEPSLGEDVTVTPVSMRQLYEMLRKGQPAEPAPKIVCTKGRPCVPRMIFNTVVTEDSVKTAVAWLEAAQESGAQAIVIELTTKGGSLDDGFILVRAIENLSVPTYCVADYEVLSIGFAILQACDHRLVTKRTQLLMHEVRLEGQAGGSAQEMANIAENLKTTSRAYVEHCQHRTKLSVQGYLSKIEGGKEWFMNWEEAVKYGIVDTTVPNGRWVEEQLRGRGLLP